ncbi:MAG: Rrf2 family transcriptional regulator [Bacteroidetes bacterium]|nr:Rrf2 family transcriptional regulator [Bacteroidota bacterium]MBL6943536.1 Rrf2 family transcriptional regulator [Bacteroidales bacterium]
MKIHTKVRYGLRAMIEIANNKSLNGLFQKQISANQKIPLKYLDSIIMGLKNTGLIVNFAGKSSGYVLSKQPNEISVYDIYRAFEPELTLVNCSYEGTQCEQFDICPSKDYWYELNNEIKNKMKSSKLLEFINENAQ